jgi:modulator of FtsH protease
VVAYSSSQWHVFFEGTIGASAALTGLLFVAISINLDQILKFPQLPGRAAGTLGLLVADLTASGFALAPGQSRQTLGVEILAVGVIVSAQAIWVTHRRQSPPEKVYWFIQHLLSLLVPGVALIIGGTSLLTKAGGGLYWVLAATLLIFVVSSLNAWVLLVEIKR